MTSPLLQKLQMVSVRKRSDRCKYQLILDSLDEETKLYISECVVLPQRHPKKLSYATLSRVLCSENQNIGSTAIGQHYNGQCSCTWNGKTDE